MSRTISAASISICADCLRADGDDDLGRSAAGGFKLTYHPVEITPKASSACLSVRGVTPAPMPANIRGRSSGGTGT